MRLSILLSLLFLAGWTFPAGQFADDGRQDAITAFSIVEKNIEATPLRLEVANAPAETAGQLTVSDDSDSLTEAAPEIAAPATVEIGSDFSALAALDGLMDEPEIEPAVPLPPRRAIPHAEVCETLADAAADNDLPAPFLIRLIWQESGFNQNVVSHAGAQGVAQFMPETAARRGLDDPFNPLHAVRASASFLRDLVNQFGNLGLAAAAYNAGPKRVQNWLDKHGQLPQETRDYVLRITGRKAEQWTVKTASAAQIRVPSRAPCQHEAGLYASNGPAQIPMPPAPPKAEADPIVTASIGGKSHITKTVSAKTRLLGPKKPAIVATKIANKDAKDIKAAKPNLGHKKVRVADAQK